VRDDFDAKIPESEAKISKTLGVPWTVMVDTGALWPLAEERTAKEQFGAMLNRYVYYYRHGFSV